MKEFSPNECSFCWHHEKEREFIVVGPMVSICNECVESCNEIIRVERQRLDKHMCDHPDCKGSKE